MNMMDDYKTKIIESKSDEQDRPIFIKTDDKQTFHIQYNDKGQISKVIINGSENLYIYNEAGLHVKTICEFSHCCFLYDNKNRMINEKHYQYTNLYYEKWYYYNDNGHCDHIVDTYGVDEWYDKDGNVIEKPPYQ